MKVTQAKENGPTLAMTGNGELGQRHAGGLQNKTKMKVYFALFLSLCRFTSSRVSLEVNKMEFGI